MNEDDTTQEARFRELLTATLSEETSKDVADDNEDAPPAERLIYVLELIASTEHKTPEDKLAAWLINAL